MKSSQTKFRVGKKMQKKTRKKNFQAIIPRKNCESGRLTIVKKEIKSVYTFRSLICCKMAEM